MSGPIKSTYSGSNRPLFANKQPLRAQKKKKKRVHKRTSHRLHDTAVHQDVLRLLKKTNSLWQSS